MNEIFKIKISKRHFAKIFSFSMVGTTDTLFLSWIISGNFLVVLLPGLTKK